MLDCAVNSIIRFKQIIGRGTRLCPDKDKYFFTIMDFRNNFAHFLDPDFDGVPIQDENFNHEPPKPAKPKTDNNTHREKIYVINGVEVSLLYESEHYFINGKFAKIFSVNLQLSKTLLTHGQSQTRKAQSSTNLQNTELLSRS